MPASGSPVYRFGDFELQPRERRLTSAGNAISLTPKVFDTLVLLVEQAGHVVSKDELMSALWPRGYVDEGSLSKHIWQIRRALGDSAKSNRFIETVPKLGYRFAMAVTCVDAPSAQSPAPAPAPAPLPAPIAAIPPMSVSASSAATIPMPRGASTAAVTPQRAPVSASLWSGRRGGLLGIIGLAVVGILSWLLHSRPMVVTQAPARDASVLQPDGRNRLVAFVRFNNLSQNPKDAWLGPALTEMLSTELGSADEIRIVPSDLVREANTDVAEPRTGGYPAASLAQLRKRLEADYVVSGSYWVANATDNPPVRVDVVMQDARTGATLSTISNQVDLAALNRLVTQTGAILRDKLGVAPPSAEFTSLVANAQPPTTDVARRIGFALDALQRHDAAPARDELLEAVAEAPGFAPAYLYLSRAWSALGYQKKALAAAEQASNHAAGLPPDQRLLVEASVQAQRGEWAKAVSAWKALVDLKPLTIEYRLSLIDAELAAGNSNAATDALSDVRRLPQAADDPRIALAAARVAAKRDDSKDAVVQAELALRLARTRESPGMIADAHLELAQARFHLGEFEPARAELAAAITSYRSVGNPHGEASARRTLALVLTDLNRGQEAREEYQRAMGIAQGVGDSATVAAIYRDLCSMLWNAGDRDGAETAARQALRIARDTGDLRLQVWTLRALASITADEGATDEVMREYREVTTLTERNNDPGGHVWSLATNADTLRLRGQLAEAHAECLRALAEASVLSDPQFKTFSGFTCALVAVDRGETQAARALLEAVIRGGDNPASLVQVPNAEMVLAQLDFEQADWQRAQERLRRAIAGFEAQEAQTGVADAEALLALCAQAQGDTAERDRAIAHAKALRAAITSRQEIYFVDIVLAKVADGPKQKTDAIARLRDLAADAERRHWLAWSLEAKLAAWQLLNTPADAQAAAVLGKDLQSQASKYGFHRILTLMKSSPAAPS